MLPPPPSSTLFPYTTLFRSDPVGADIADCCRRRHQRTRQRIAVDQARATDLIGQRGINVAIGPALRIGRDGERALGEDRKSTRLNSSHTVISYAVFCLKKKT